MEVFAGNRSESTMVWEQVQALAERYRVDEVVFCGDRGMTRVPQREGLRQWGYKTLSALGHPELRGLLEQRAIEPELWNERTVCLTMRLT